MEEHSDLVNNSMKFCSLVLYTKVCGTTVATVLGRGNVKEIQIITNMHRVQL